MDYTKLSTEDLLALKEGDLNSVSTEGLLYLREGLSKQQSSPVYDDPFGAKASAEYLSKMGGTFVDSAEKGAINTGQFFLRPAAALTGSETLNNIVQDADAWVRDADERQKQREEGLGTAGKIGLGIAGLGGTMLSQAPLLAASAPISAAMKAPGIVAGVGNTVKTALAAGAPLAAGMTNEEVQTRLAHGKPMSGAELGSAMVGNTLFTAAPMGAAGNVGKRIMTGAATQPVVGAGVEAMRDVATGNVKSLADYYNPENRALDIVSGGLMHGVMGHGAEPSIGSENRSSYNVPDIHKIVAEEADRLAQSHKESIDRSEKTISDILEVAKRNGGLTEGQRAVLEQRLHDRFESKKAHMFLTEDSVGQEKLTKEEESLQASLKDIANLKTIDENGNVLYDPAVDKPKQVVRETTGSSKAVDDHQKALMNEFVQIHQMDKIKPEYWDRLKEFYDAISAEGVSNPDSKFNRLQRAINFELATHLNKDDAGWKGIEQQRKSDKIQRYTREVEQLRKDNASPDIIKRKEDTLAQIKREHDALVTGDHAGVSLHAFKSDPYIRSILETKSGGLHDLSKWSTGKESVAEQINAIPTVTREEIHAKKFGIEKGEDGKYSTARLRREGVSFDTIPEVWQYLKARKMELAHLQEGGTVLEKYSAFMSTDLTKISPDVLKESLSYKKDLLSRISPDNAIYGAVKEEAYRLEQELDSRGIPMSKESKIKTLSDKLAIVNDDLARHASNQDIEKVMTSTEERNKVLDELNSLEDYKADTPNDGAAIESIKTGEIVSPTKDTVYRQGVRRQANELGVRYVGRTFEAVERDVLARLNGEPVEAVDKLHQRIGDNWDLLYSFVENAGWQEVGGRIIRENGREGDVIGRTKWIPKEEWFGAGLENSPEKLKQDLQKLQQGNDISVKSKRTLERILDYMDYHDVPKEEPLSENKPVLGVDPLKTTTKTMEEIKGNFSERLKEAARNGDYPGALSIVKEFAQHQIDGGSVNSREYLYIKHLSDHIASNKNIKPMLDFILSTEDAGHYNAMVNKIDLNNTSSVLGMLHETVHAVTSGVLMRYEVAPHTLTTEQRVAAYRIKDIFDMIKKRADHYGIKPDAMRNIREFTAYATTDPGTMLILKNVKYDKFSVVSKLVESVKKLLGIKDKNTSNAMDHMASAVGNLTDHYNLKQAQVSKSIAEAIYGIKISDNPLQSAADISKAIDHVYHSTEDYTTVRNQKDVEQDIAKYGDISRSNLLASNTALKFMTRDTLKYWFDHPLLKQVFSSIRKATDVRDHFLNMNHTGELDSGIAKSKLGVLTPQVFSLGNQHKSDPHEILRKASNKDLQAIAPAIFGGYGVDYATTLQTHGGNWTAKQRELFNVITGAYRFTYDTYNRFANQHGLQPLPPPQPGWHYASRNGNHVIVVSKHGVPVRVEAYDVKLKAELEHGTFKDALAHDPNFTVDLVDIGHMDSESRQVILSNMEDFLRNRGKNTSADDVADVVAYLDKLRKAGPHSMYRRNVAGYNGTQIHLDPYKQAEALRNSVFDMWNDYGNRLYKQVAAHSGGTENLLSSGSVKQQAPLALELAQSVYNHSVTRSYKSTGIFEAGKQNIHYFENELGKMLNKYTKGLIGGDDWGTETNILNTAHVVATNTFYISQILARITQGVVQPLQVGINVPHKLIMETGIKAPKIAINSLWTFLTGGKGLLGVGADPAYVWHLQEARAETNIFTSHNYREISPIGEKMKRYEGVTEAVTGAWLAGKGEAASRHLTFILMYNMLKEKGVAQSELMHKAAAATDDLMCKFDNGNVPPWVTQLGPIGAMIRPLLQMGTHQKGITMQWFKSVFDNPKRGVPALAASYLMIAMITGLKGVPGIQEYEQLRNNLPEDWTINWPSALELLTKMPKMVDGFAQAYGSESKAEALQTLWYGTLANKTGMDVTTMLRSQSFLPVLDQGYTLGNLAPQYGSTMAYPETWIQMIKQMTGMDSRLSSYEVHNNLKNLNPVLGWKFLIEHTHPTVFTHDQESFFKTDPMVRDTKGRALHARDMYDEVGDLIKAKSLKSAVQQEVNNINRLNQKRNALVDQKSLALAQEGMLDPAQSYKTRVAMEDMIRRGTNPSTISSGLVNLYKGQAVEDQNRKALAQGKSIRKVEAQNLYDAVYGR